MLIDWLKLFETGEMERQYRRPWKIETSGGTVNRMYDELERSTELRPTAVAHAIRDVVKMSSSKLEDVDITHDTRWSDNRYRFIMSVSLNPGGSRSYSKTRLIISGFTDRADISHDDYIAEDLRMYINSVVHVRDTEQRGDDGRYYTKTVILDQNQVLLGRYTNDNNDEYMLRPSDVFNNLNRMADMGEDPDDDIIDTRVMFSRGIEFSARNNNLGNRYIANLVNSDLSGLAESRTYDSGIASTTRDVMSADASREALWENNEFLAALADRTSLADERWFEYDQLAPFTDTKNYDGVDRITEVTPIEGNRGNWDSEHWHGADPATMTALHFCHAIPTLMVDSLLSSVEIFASNEESRDGRMEVEIVGSHSIVGEGFDDEEVLYALRDRLLMEVLNPMTNSDQIPMTMEVFCDLGGVTDVKLNWDGDREEPYIFPTFADSMLVPVVTEDGRNLNKVTDDYLSLRKVVNEVRGDGVLSVDARDSDRGRRGRGNGGVRSSGGSRLLNLFDE